MGLNTLSISIIVAIIVGINSIGIYYVYEYLWQRHINRINIKKGTSIFLKNDKHNWYEVIEVLDDNKIVIKVI